MKKMLVLSLLLSAMLLSPKTAFSAEPKSPAEPNQPAKIEVPRDPNYVVASFDGKTLTMREINYFAPNADFETVKNVADFWLNTQLIYEDAVKKGVDKDAKTKLMADIAFKKSIASVYIDQVQSSAKVTDDEVKKYYEENKQTDPRLKEPVYLSFSHITTDTLEQAQAVRERLEKGEEINELAKTVSVASDAKKGGKAGKFREDTVRQRYGQDFLKALEDANEGQILGPIKNKEGKYEIIRHEGKRMARLIEFDKAKDQIKSTLESQAKKNAVENLLKDLRENAKDRYKKTGVFSESENADAKDKNSEK